MKKIKKSEVLYLSAIMSCYWTNKFVLRNAVENIFIDCYLNDLLGGMLFALILVWSSRIWLLSEISDKYVLLLTLVAGLFWEYITPLYYRYSIRDNYDILFYCIGGFTHIKIKKFFK